MRRKLIAIGCNSYQYLNPLECAENDAECIFSALVASDVGDYDKSSSCLLLSPNRLEIEESLNSLFQESEQIDVFTFFFAGHGGVKAGSYYICPVDGKLEALSATGVSLSELLLKINEAAPKQTNIIIDACEGGGLGGDLGTLLKSPALGEGNASSVVLLATCSKDESAHERNGQGAGTKAILECINGKTFIQDLTAALDLTEISKAVFKSLSNDGGQTPIAYGVNLFGSSRFCRNPHYASDRGEPLREILPLWPEHGDSSSFENRYRRIRDIYVSIEKEWEPRAFSQLIDPIFADFQHQPSALVAFAERLNAALMTRAAGSLDKYRAPLVTATISTSLLRFSQDDMIKKCMISMQKGLVNSLNETHQLLISDLRNDPFVLLQLTSPGMNELFTLPNRISQILAWCAISTLIEDGSASQIAIMDELYCLIMDTYQGLVRLMSDEQASSTAVLLCALRRFGRHDMAEETLGLLFSSLLEAKGCLACKFLDPKLVLNYLLMRASGEYDRGWNEIANPSEAVAVILKAGLDLGLEEVFDKDLWLIDKRNLLIFEPSSPESFADATIASGVNTVLQIGRDVFNLQDLKRMWPPTIPSKVELEIDHAMMISSILYPDRVAWTALSE